MSRTFSRSERRLGAKRTSDRDADRVELERHMQDERAARRKRIKAAKRLSLKVERMTWLPR